jgi:peptidoglycan/LPS O-acetylase OafA/YrhL
MPPDTKFDPTPPHGTFIWGLTKPTLGWLRVLLALMVVDFHYGFFYGHIGPVLENHFGALAWIHDGMLAVFGFFILSGYLVADMIERRYPLRGAKDLGHFLLGRYARIYPLYWIVILLFGLLWTSSHLTLWKMIANISLFPYGLWAFFMNHQQVGSLTSKLELAPAWTLSLDLVFYVIGAILLNSRRYLFICTAICIAFIMSAWWMAPSGIGAAQYKWWRVQFYTSVEPNLLAFLLGLIIRLNRQYLPRSNWLALTAFLVLIYTAYIPVGLGYFADYCFYILALVWLVHHLGGAGRGPYEAFLGNWTFSIYLVHGPIESFVIFWGTQKFAHLEILSLLISVILATLLAILVEPPLEKLRHTWLKHPFSSDKWGGNRWDLMAISICVLCVFSTLWYLMHGV